MEEVKFGKCHCENCNKDFKWRGYKSIKSKLSSQPLMAFDFLDMNFDGIEVDLANADKCGFVLASCPECDSLIKIDSNNYNK